MQTRGMRMASATQSYSNPAGTERGRGDRQASVFSMPQSWVYSYVQVKSDCRTLGMVVVPQGLHALSTCEPIKEKRIILSNFDL